MRLLFSLLVLGGLVAIGAYAYGLKEQKQQQKAAQAETPVTIASPVQRTIADRVDALGTAAANESITITPTTADTIREIRFTDGQLVKKGDIILLLNQDEENAALAAAVAAQKDNLREVKRLERLLKSKAASERDLEARRTALEVSEGQIKEITARIEERTLRASFSGRLGIRRMSEGALVQPGDVITTLDDVSMIKLDFSVPSTHIRALAPGLPIKATSAELGTAFSGTVAFVDTRIDPVSRAVLVRAILPNADERIKPGMLLGVQLLPNQRSAWMVPEESVLQRQQDHFLMIVGPDKRIEQRKVKTGAREDGFVEITDGISGGEHVVTRGISRVRPGQKVALNPAEPN